MTILTPDEIRRRLEGDRFARTAVATDALVTALAALSVAKRLMEGWEEDVAHRQWIETDYRECFTAHAMSDDEAAVLALLRTEEP